MTDRKERLAGRKEGKLDPAPPQKTGSRGRFLVLHGPAASRYWHGVYLFARERTVARAAS